MNFAADLVARILFILICRVFRAQSSDAYVWTESEKKSFEFENVSSHIICYQPKYLKPQFQHLWSSVEFSFNSLYNGYSVCYGANETHVEDQCTSFSRFTRFFWMQRIQSLSVSPFNKSCVFVESKEAVSVELQIRPFDALIFARLLLGLFLFFLASRLSRSVIFYYGSGISLGILASVLIAIFLLSRLMPEKRIAFGFLAATCSVTAYFVRRTFQDVQQFAYSHIEYLIVYFFLSGLLGFCIFYYKGPVSNPRLLNIMKWAIQLFALVLIYSGTRIPEVSGTFVIITVVVYLLPVSSCGLGEKLKRSWRIRFPKKIRLLTEEEYQEQGRIETQKALEELKSFCRSPDCHAWRTMSRLSSPARFAQWVEGVSDHIQDQEVIDHDSNPSPRIVYDDIHL